jgi:hypothetical protein
MKAKVIKTGEVVEVHKTTTGWASDNLNTTRFFNESELDFDYREWESFRREAAKDFTVALVSSGYGLNPKTIAYAIEMSEELIEQLRRKKNEKST